jgi:EmrB/QacA subfamily drug resistance transporter
VVAITVLGSGIAALDATVVNIALPTIGRDFHTGIAALQWVMTSYILTLAAFLLIGGSLGDRFGRRKVYLIGVVWFALASAACGFAPNADLLIVTRVLQGVGGALLTPGSLAILEASFTPADRARAIGAWSGLGGVAIAAGPLIGGYLISAASWRWIFFINVPIAAVVVALGARHIPESRDPSTTGRLDYAGALAAVVFLSGITFAFIEAPALGWASPVVLTMTSLGAAGLVAFLVREHRAAAPMLPLSIFRERQFAAASAVTFIVYGALTGATFLLPVVLQVSSGYSPLASGLALLPLTVIMLALSARSGQLAARIGPRLQLTAATRGPLRRRRGRTSGRRGDRSARRRSSRAAARGKSLRARRRMVLSRRAGWSGARAGTSWRRPRSARSTAAASVSRPPAACRPAAARSAR